MKKKLKTQVVRRDFSDKKYCVWRALVKARDKHKCKMCNLIDNSLPYPANNLEVHHIVRWHDEPNLRYVVSNGITLCKKCHEIVTGKERTFASALRKLIQ